MADPADVSNDSYDETLAGTSVCYGLAMDMTTQQIVDSSTFACNAENVNGSDPTYYIDNDTVHPLSEWDFQSEWKTQANAYPQLGAGANNNGNDGSGSGDNGGNNGGGSGDNGGGAGDGGETVVAVTMMEL